MMEAFQELIHISVAGVNLTISILLILMLLYWISVIFGALDIDILQFDFDVEAEGDADLDLQSGGAFQGLMLYFNIGCVPVTVWLSFLIFTCWILTVLECYYLNPGINPLLSLAFVLPNLIIGMYVAKFATAPLKKVFEAMAPKNITHKSLIGQRATVASSTVTHKFGQILIKTDGAPITLNAVTEGTTEIPKGASVILTGEARPGVFIVEPFSAL
jgi:hypothetical protein